MRLSRFNEAGIAMPRKRVHVCASLCKTYDVKQPLPLSLHITTVVRFTDSKVVGTTAAAQAKENPSSLMAIAAEQ